MKYRFRYWVPLNTFESHSYNSMECSQSVLHFCWGKFFWLSVLPKRYVDQIDLNAKKPSFFLLCVFYSGPSETENFDVYLPS